MPYLSADTDLSTLGTVGGIVTVVGFVAGLIGGGIVWLRNAKKDARKDAIAEWQALLTESKAQAMADAARKDARIKDLENQRKSYKEMAEEAIEVSEREVNAKRAGDGKLPFVAPAGVVPEHSSPVTTEQQETADMQTARARITAVKVALDLPPREAGEQETPEQRKSREAGEDEKKVESEAAGTPRLDALMAASLKKAVAQVPEQTAQKVVEKLDEREGKP